MILRVCFLLLFSLLFRYIYVYIFTKYGLIIGFLGSFTCVLCAYLGAEAAKILLLFPSSKQRIVRWFIWSVVTVIVIPQALLLLSTLFCFNQGLIGGALCSFSINDGPIPINKNLWSLSFVLITSSIAFSILSVLYIFIDALAWWSGAPFRYAGNSFSSVAIWIILPSAGLLSNLK